MNLTPEIMQQIDRYLDEGAPLPPEIEERLKTSEECKSYLQERKRLLNLLGALPQVEAPADLADGVMAFIERSETEAAARSASAEAPPQPTLWRGALDTLCGLIPDIQIPQVIRREAWALSLSVLAILWGTLIGPQVQSGQAQAYLVPMAQDVIAIADTLHVKSLQLSDRLAVLANDLITPDAKPSSENVPSENGQDSGASMHPLPKSHQTVMARIEEYSFDAHHAHC